MDDLLPIGAVAKRSGLSLRALRLYDGLGLLRPVDVDPATGYRRYAEVQVAQAVLIARLREADVPLSEVAAVLAEPDGGSRRARLERWWAGRELDVDRQRDLVAALGRHLEQEPTTITTHQIDATVLTEALTAVLRSVSHDETIPVINGVFLEPSAGGIRLVGTDTYRLAVWDVPATTAGGQPVLLPRAALQGLLSTLVAGGAGTVVIEVDEDGIVVRHAAVDTEVAVVPGAFPAYRRLVDAAPVTATLVVDRDALRAAVRSAAGPGPDGAGCYVRLAPGEDALAVWCEKSGTPPVSVAATASGRPVAVVLDARYLLDGLDSFPAAASLTVGLAGTLSPVTLRAAGTDAVYVLMPVRTDEPAAAATG